MFKIGVIRPIQQLSKTTIKMQAENNGLTTNALKPEQRKPNNGEIEDEDSSQWSLASLQELKAMNLRQLEQNQQPMEHHPKQKEPIQVKFPQKPTLLVNAPLHQVGKIIFIVGQLLIVQSKGGAFVVDLDNWICDQQRNLFGFIIDVFGKIEKPFYSIKPEATADFTAFVGNSVYYIEGSSKILKDQDIKSMKSKSALEAEEQQDQSSQDQKVRVQRDFSEERHERRKSPQRRVNKFKEHQRFQRQEGSRERTRQHHRNNRHMNNSRGRNEQNQRYLNSVYSMHYNQMMRLYNGEFQPNNPPPLQNPYINYQNRPQNNIVPHSNIAQFGVNNVPNQFYGQVFPSNQSNGLFGNSPQTQLPPQQLPQQGLFVNPPPQGLNHQGYGNSNGNPFNGRQ